MEHDQPDFYLPTEIVFDLEGFPLSLDDLTLHDTGLQQPGKLEWTNDDLTLPSLDLD